MCLKWKYDPFVAGASELLFNKAHIRDALVVGFNQLPQDFVDWDKIAYDWQRKPYTTHFFVGLVVVMAVTQIHIDDASVKVIRYRDVKEASNEYQPDIAKN